MAGFGRDGGWPCVRGDGVVRVALHAAGDQAVLQVENREVLMKAEYGLPFIRATDEGGDNVMRLAIDHCVDKVRHELARGRRLGLMADQVLAIPFQKPRRGKDGPEQVVSYCRLLG